MKQKRSFYKRWHNWAAGLKLQTYASYLAYKNPRVPWYAKVFGALVIAYAFSPVDLIPDFIPILGYLDDLILIPIGIAIAVRMIPKDIMQECLCIAQSELSKEKRKNWPAGIIVIFIWVFAGALIVTAVLRKMKKHPL